MSVGNKHKRLLDRVRKRPTPSDVRWRDIEALVVHLGGTVKAKRGSVRIIELNGMRLACHEPHGPSGAALPKGLVKRISDFLEKSGAESE